jgi:galactose mutarotase-like enzyme
MTAKIDAHWRYHDLRAVVIENPGLRVVVMPETGGRIYSLVHKASDTEFLWHNPRTAPRAVPFGASFDNTLVGGWDELLPTADACIFNHESIPDHGELWSLPWDWQIVPKADGSACLYTSVFAPITPLRFERWLVLDAEQPELRIRYRITNEAAYPLDLIWGIHPMFAISPDHHLDLPGGQMLVGQASTDRLGKVGQRYEWPMLPTDTGTVDMRQLPSSEAMTSAGHYAVAPSQPWFALTNQRTQVGVAMFYPPDVFRALWIWMSFSGWRNLYHLAVEPWVGYPVSLDQAVEAGRQRVLPANQSLDYEVSLLAYTGITQVTAVEQQGQHLIVHA